MYHFGPQVEVDVFGCYVADHVESGEGFFYEDTDRESQRTQMYCGSDCSECKFESLGWAESDSESERASELDALDALDALVSKRICCTCDSGSGVKICAACDKENYSDSEETRSCCSGGCA